MPIRVLEPFITASQVRQTEATPSLAGTRLGIDANHWLKWIVNNCKDPTLPPLGGTLPLTLQQNIERDIAYWRLHKIVPVVVFSGFTVRSKADRLFAPEQNRTLRRTEAWDAYMQGALNSAYAQWNLLQAYYIDMQPAIMHILTTLNVDFIRAPYSSWGQLTYFLNHPKLIIHAVYAGSDLLMFDVDRIITNFDFANNTFSWIDKPNFLTKLSLTKSQFLDACILAGFDWISTYPPLVAEPEPFSWNTLRELVRSCQTGLSLVERLGEPSDAKERYKDDYARVRCGVRNHLVLNVDGDIEPLDKKTAPMDLHDVFGHRLPLSVYWHLAQGHISPSLVSPALFSTQPEFAPACGGECLEYQMHVTRWANVRALAVTLAMADWGHSFWHHRKLTSINWYQPFEETTIDTSTIRNSSLCPNGTGSNFRVPADWLKTNVPALKDALSKCVELPLVSFLSALSNTAAQQTIGADRVKNIDQFQLAAAVSLKFLDIRGYITSDTHLPTPLGKALLNASSTSIPEFPLELMLVTELLRDGVLHGNPYSRVYHPTPQLNPTGALPLITVLARLACALEPSLMTQELWTAELNRDLLAVSSLYKHTARTLHGLLEGILLSFASNASTVATVPYVASRLPYALIHGVSGNKTASMGLLIHVYLVELLSPTHQPYKAETTRAAVQSSVVQRFAAKLPNAGFEIERFTRFLHCVARLVKSIPVTNNAHGTHTEFQSQSILRAISWWELVHSGTCAPSSALAKVMSPSSNKTLGDAGVPPRADGGKSDKKSPGAPSASRAGHAPDPAAKTPPAQNQQLQRTGSQSGGRGNKNRRGGSATGKR